MPVSQPPINRDDNVRSSYDLEVAQLLNQLEQQIRDLQQRVAELESR